MALGHSVERGKVSALVARTEGPLDHPLPSLLRLQGPGRGLAGVL